MIFEVKITDLMRQRSQVKAEEMGSLNNSILNGTGNYAGFLGEEIVNDYIRGTIENTYDYDIIKDGLKFDVKSKQTTVVPRTHYDCSVPDFNPNQKCDFYIFARILDDFSIGWILGFISKERFYQEARFMRKGQMDGSNDFIVKSDCYNLAIKRLSPIAEIFNIIYE